MNDEIILLAIILFFVAISFNKIVDTISEIFDSNPFDIKKKKGEDSEKNEKNNKNESNFFG